MPHPDLPNSLQVRPDPAVLLYSPHLRNGLLDLRLHQRYDEVIHFMGAGKVLV
jgi:hypothetical protein